MIKKILKLNKIGKFSSFNQEEDFQYEENKNCNIIFGFNGSGKTTLSNVISFFSDNSFIGEEEKKVLFNDLKNEKDAEVELSLQEGTKIKYPASYQHEKSIFVFNSNFIESHVFNGTKGNIKKFLNVGGELKNKEIDYFTSKINELSKENDNLQVVIDALIQKNKEMTGNKSKIFGKTLTDKNKKLLPQNLDKVQLPSVTIESLEQKLSLLSSDYELSKKQSELNSDIEELTQISFVQSQINFVLIDDLLSKNIQQLSKEVLEVKIKEVQNFFIKEEYKLSVERWFRFGKEVLEKTNEQKEKICPLCSSDITGRLNTILENYKGYFDESYENFIIELDELWSSINAIIESVSQIEKNSIILKKLYIKYEKMIGKNEFENFEFNAVKHKLSQLADLLKDKKDNIQGTFSKSTNVEIEIEKFNNIVLKLDTLKNNILKKLESKELNTNKIEGQIRETFNNIIVLEFNLSDKNGGLIKYKNNKNRISIILNSESEGLPFYKRKLSEELKKLKTESKSISKYLNKMGIDHFDIDINENKQDENIIIKYKNLANEKNRLKNCLSEGEKTALAFAYFLSKYNNDIDSVKRIDSVVVIDDPISSLDENRLYSTAYLVYSTFNQVKELIVLSHNFLFLKYFNSFYSGKSKCLFLDNDKISKLPEELNNFETPYFYMLKNIIDFINNNNIVYNQAKRYLPNFIRRVLETFLSYKFSRIVDRTGGYRSPGLKDYKELLDNTSFDKKMKEQLKEKILEINKIADAHSHGNAHHAQEIFYISEVDLRLMAENTLFIIDQMDNMHYSSFINTINN